MQKKQRCVKRVLIDTSDIRLINAFFHFDKRTASMRIIYRKLRSVSFPFFFFCRDDHIIAGNRLRALHIRVPPRFHANANY